VAVINLSVYKTVQKREDFQSGKLQLSFRGIFPYNPSLGALSVDSVESLLSSGHLVSFSQPPNIRYTTTSLIIFIHRKHKKPVAYREKNLTYLTRKYIYIT